MIVRLSTKKSNIETHKYFGQGLNAVHSDCFHVSITSHAASTKTPIHYHKNPYLCLLLDGMYEEENKGDKTVLQAGSVLYREAGNEHANTFSNQEGRCLNIEILAPNQLMDENDLLLPSVAIERIGTKEIYSICESLRTNQFEDVLNIQCYEAFVAHFEMLPVIGNPVWIQSVKELIHDDPFAKLSLSYLSQQFNLHPNYIIRKFKKCTGFKLSEYMTKIRLESAMAGMIRTNDDLTKIAHDNGFYDQSHFTRNFKRQFGDTPTNLRKNLKG